MEQLLPIHQVREEFTDRIQDDDLPGAEIFLYAQHAMMASRLLQLKDEYAGANAEAQVSIAVEIIAGENFLRELAELIGHCRTMLRADRRSKKQWQESLGLYQIELDQLIAQFKHMLADQGVDWREQERQSVADLLSFYMQQLAELRAELELVSDPKDVTVICSRIIEAEDLVSGLQAKQGILSRAGITQPHKPIPPKLARRLALAKHAAAAEAEIKRVEGIVKKLETQLQAAEALCKLDDKAAVALAKQRYPSSWKNTLPTLKRAIIDAREEAPHLRRDLKNWKNRLALLKGE